MTQHDPLAIARTRRATTRLFSAENPNGTKAGGAQAAPGADRHTHPASQRLGKPWKVRPCLRDMQPGETFVLVDCDGPGIVQHIWFTVLASVHRQIAFEVYYDHSDTPAIRCPVGDFFANGIDGLALVNSEPVTVAPFGGMNSYWPMPFREHIKIVVRNDGFEKIDEFFYAITLAEQDIPDDAGYLHASWRRAVTTREHPEFTIADHIKLDDNALGHYAGTYLVWNQLSNGWWGEGEIKFFIDGDTDDAPSLCGTGTEDYFGGAWGFIHNLDNIRPRCFSAPYLGYPQAIYESDPKAGQRVPAHGLYRWHLPDPIHFASDLRVTVQALGWYPPAKSYQPLTDDLAAVAYWYQTGKTALDAVPVLPDVIERLPR